MKRVKWFVAALAVGTLFFGCKAKEQTAEAPPPEQPQAEATAAPKVEPQAAAAARPEATASAPTPAPRAGYDRALLRAALLYDKASFFRVVPSFIVQFGISAYPPVAAAWEKVNIQDEPVTQSNKRGYLTYAKTSLPN